MSDNTKDPERYTGIVVWPAVQLASHKHGKEQVMTKPTDNTNDAEVASLRANAERYIYLRDFNPTHILVEMFLVPYIGINSKEQAQETLDAAIDAARGTT